MKHDKAIEALRVALQVSPDNLPLRHHLASTLGDSGRLTEAQAELEEALRRMPQDVGTLLELSRILARRNRPEEAAARLSEALQADEGRAEVHLEMARALWALRSPQKAATHYERAMKLDPTLSDPELESALTPTATEPIATTECNDTPDDNTQSSIIAGLGIPLEQPKINFKDVGGMEAIKEQIRFDIVYPFQHPELYAAYGKKVGGGILLYGPPGCGKTYLARATAGECQARFIAVGIQDVLNMWMGESERRMHAIFEAARAATPSIIFFDELEALAGKRAGMEHSPHYRALVNQFLAELDGIKSDNSNLLVIGATNSPWHVDPAFRRPGRFDKVLFVPPPDEEARIAIMKLHCRNKPVEEIDFAVLARQMKRFSGADVAAVCEAAAEIGLRETLRTGKLRELRTEDFAAALASTRSTTDEWLSTAQNYVLYSNQTGLYDAIAQYLQAGED